ncbi:MAG: conserved phage C-terminal domain-containing protein [Lachnospiraceae bacterium]|nr:conserved phage C-terminal domain-containing protein [Lachnospiraceae bacterium]
MIIHTGYNKETIIRLLERFEKVHDLIRFSPETKEILILNWYKYNWSKSPLTLKGVRKEAERIKCEAFMNYVLDVAKCVETDTPCKGYIYPIQASVTVTVLNNNTNGIIDLNNKDLNTKNLQNTTLGEKNKVCNSNKQLDIYKEQREEIIRYLNEKIGARYKSETYETRKAINGRLEEGYTVSDFVEVIDKKVADWQGTDMEKYLRPDTLFRQSKFESYLNQKETKGKKERDLLDEWRNA